MKQPAPPPAVEVQSAVPDARRYVAPAELLEKMLATESELRTTQQALAASEAKTEKENRLKKAALERARAAEDSADKQTALADRRLESRREAEAELAPLKVRVMELQEQGARPINDFKKISGGTAGARVWPLWITQLIIEMLINGTPPSAIPPNIAAQAELSMPGKTIDELPSEKYCKDMRAVLQVVVETLVAYRLAKANVWEQLFVDGTCRRQVAMQTLLIAVEEAGMLKPLLVSCSHILEGETSEQQCEAVLDMLERGGKRLTRLAAVFTRLFPNHPHDIPGAHEMNIGKLGSGGAVTSDTCNAALKTSRLLEEAIVTAAKEMGNEEPAVLQIRCWNHLRNVWVGGMTKKLSARLNDELHDELKAIDFRLRVSTSFESVLRALDKEFSLCANYPKGHGEEFLPWMELRHPGALLLHVARSKGSRQDLVTNGAGCLYCNRQYYVEFLDERLRIPGAANILQVRRPCPCRHRHRRPRHRHPRHRRRSPFEC